MIIQAVAMTSVFLVLAMFAIASRSRRKTEAAKELLPFSESSESGAARDSVPPTSDGVKLVAKSGGSTARELRKEDIRQRQATKLCLYCDLVSTQPQPVLKLSKSALDWLYLKLGVVPVSRWAVDPDPRHWFSVWNMTAEQIQLAHPICLCSTHHAMARSHLERKVAENQSDYATFVSKQRLEMYEFQQHALDEVMSNDANEIRRGKKGKRAQDAQNPRAVLKAVNGGGA